MFTVGQRVIYRPDSQSVLAWLPFSGQEAEVLEVDRNGFVLIQFKERFPGMHGGNGKGAENRCWWSYPENLQPLDEPEPSRFGQFVIITDDITQNSRDAEIVRFALTLEDARTLATENAFRDASGPTVPYLIYQLVEGYEGQASVARVV